MARPATSLVPKVEDFLAIDIARLRRNGLTSVGSSGDISWARSRSSATAATASVGYVLQEGGLRLHYTHTRHGGCAAAHQRGHSHRQDSDTVRWTAPLVRVPSVQPALSPDLWWLALSLSAMSRRSIRLAV